MILEMQNVVKRFGGLTAVSNMSFHVEKGEIFGVIGPNGAGKTTIFNLITGVYPVSEGDILFDGQSIINGGIARTFQNIRLFTGMTVLENILVGQHDHLKAGFLASILHTGAQKKEEKEARKEAMELLRFVGLEQDADRPATELPYGKQRKLEIARAIATRCCSPPLSSLGRWFRRWDRPTRAISSVTYSTRGLLPMEEARHAFSSAVSFGSRLKLWNTKPSSLFRTSASCLLLQVVTSRPPSR